MPVLDVGKGVPSIKGCIAKQVRASVHFSVSARMRKVKLLMGLPHLIKAVFSSSDIQA